MTTAVPTPSRPEHASARRVLAFAATLLLAVLLSCSLTGPGAKAAPSSPLTGLRLVDYFPAADGWGSMWSNWRASRIETDFARIAALHANGVRVIVNAPVFGYPDPDPLMVDRLRQTIAIASRYGLRVELTLFDGWQEYEDLAGSKAWASELISTLAGDPRIAYVDLHNELPADTDAAALRWAATMIPFVQARDGGIPVTASTSISSGVAPLRALVDRLRSSPPDLYDVHYYGNAPAAFAILQQAKALAGKTPLFVGETGFATDSSYGWAAGLQSTDASLEAYQDYYFRMVEYAAMALGVPAASPWILYDMPGQGDTRWGHHMGILRPDGARKPAATTLAKVFSGNPIGLSFNNGFEHYSGSSPLPSIWRRWLPSEADFSVDRSVAHSGSASARIENAAGDHHVGCPAYYAAPIAAVRPGITYTAAAWLRGRATAGISRLTIVWSGASGAYVASSNSSALPTGTTGWTHLSVSAKPPDGARAVEISLQSCENSGATWFDDVTFAPSSEGVDPG